MHAAAASARWRPPGTAPGRRRRPRAHGARPGSARRAEPPVTCTMRARAAAGQRRAGRSGRTRTPPAAAAPGRAAWPSSSVVIRSPPPNRPFGDIAFTARSKSPAVGNGPLHLVGSVRSATMPLPGKAAAVSSRAGDAGRLPALADQVLGDHAAQVAGAQDEEVRHRPWAGGSAGGSAAGGGSAGGSAAARRSRRRRRRATDGRRRRSPTFTGSRSAGVVDLEELALR